MILYSTGIRVSELSNLEIKDTFKEELKDKVKGMIYNGKGRKDRSFYIP